MTDKFLIDRKKQRQKKKERFFDSNVMKMLGLALIFIVVLWVVFGLCVVGDSDFASQTYGLAEKVSLMWFAAFLSAAGVKAEVAK